ncbi:arsenical pump-driving ATPase [Bacillus salitolerans]|uniref:Arsenical pump-driving ATPase n=1 Tax=Bacillus salitolerans TaxID=1437434 RepID=A0ABW4LRE9_9BACI
MQMFEPQSVSHTPFLFFTGKGGVGKTSTACATAVSLADLGKKVLIVSTDPASNLQDVFEIELTSEPKQIPHTENLYACNLDPEEAASKYRERVIGPYRGLLPQSVLVTMEEQLSGACTVEIAAFDEFTNLLTNTDLVEEYDYILFDTAPTGHTIRLLQLPLAWSGYLEESTHGASCLGPLSGLGEKKEIYEKTVNALSDPSQTTLLIVTRPESSSFYEAERASKELRELGINNQRLIINGVLQRQIENDPISHAFYKRQQEAIENIPNGLKEITTFSLPFVSYTLTGLEHLRLLFSNSNEMSTMTEETVIDDKSVSSIKSLISSFSEQGTRIIFTMGKGGVGKTTVASMIAVGLVEKGHKVHLTTTDPAAHLDLMFQAENNNDLLTISRINPTHEVEVYKNEVVRNASATLNEEALAYLEEDLNSPCTEEIAVFRAFAAMVEKSKDEVIVIDTAPTGHTLLLLDAAEAYHKEIARSTGEVPESVRNLLPRLRNKTETSVVIVTLAEATPVLEASRLQEDLKRADIIPTWWIINQSLYTTKTIDPILNGRAKAEKAWIQKVTSELATKCTILPWFPEEKVGYESILQSLE